MNIYCVNHSYKYELEKLSRLFFPLEKFEIKDGAPEGDFSGLLSKITKTPEETTFFAVLKVGEKESKKEKNASFFFCRKRRTRVSLSVL